MKSSSSVSQNWFVPIIICVYFFATAKFYFFNILGIRKEILYFIIVLTFLYAIGRIDYFRKVLKKKNIILLTLYSLIFVWLIRFNIEWATLLITATILISSILYSHQKIFDLSIKLIIVVGSVFALLVIIQAFIYIVDPSVFNDVYRSVQGVADNAGQITILHPIQYLGFWSSGRVHLLGIELPRFASFASEPSILVTIFLIPGLLGLTYSGFIRKLSYLVLFSSIVLASAGTIYLSLAFGIVVFLSLFVFRLLKKHKFKLILNFLTFVLVSVIIFVGYLLITKNAYSIIHLLDNSLSSYSNYSSILGNSGHKSLPRIIANQEAFNLLLANPFGFNSKDVLTATGLLLNYSMQLGFLGVLLCGIIFISIIEKFASVFYFEMGLMKKIASALIIGTLIQTLLFSGYGWMAPSGLIMTAMLYRRAQNMLEIMPQKIKS